MSHPTATRCAVTSTICAKPWTSLSISSCCTMCPAWATGWPNSMKTERGLTRRLGRELLLQAVYISLAVIVSVYVAARLMESVLIEQAIKQEADYYWSREADRPGSALPDTKNLTAYRHGMGDGVPAYLGDLPPGFHS